MARCVAVICVEHTKVRSLIISESGDILGNAIHEFPTTSPMPGAMEQNPEHWYGSAVYTMRQAVAMAGKNAEIIAVTITNDPDVLTPMDELGRNLYPGICWLDTRTSQGIEHFREVFPQRHGLYKILLLRDYYADAFYRTFKFGTSQTYIIHKLCRRFAIDTTNAPGLGLDIRSMKWNESMLTQCGVPVEMLPEVFPPGTVVGALSIEAARDMDLPENISVILGGATAQCGAVGVGAVRDATAKISVDTSLNIDVCASEPLFDYFDKPTKMYMLPHAIEGKWLLEATLPGTGLALRWFRDNCCSDIIQDAKRANRNPYDVMNVLAERSSPGAEGLLFVPLMLYGRGIFYNLDLNMKKNSMIRAIMEGAAYSARFFLEMMHGLNAYATEVYLDGGGARSKVWRQIMADIIGRPVSLMHASSESAGMGAAVISFASLGVYDGINKAVDSMVEEIEKVKPRAEYADLYARNYQKFQELLMMAGSDAGPI
ncbi:MAG: FGGY-family carbohydrate kinase [Thermoplasmata archaeon]